MGATDAPAAAKKEKKTGPESMLPESNEKAKPSVSYATQIAQQQELAKSGQLEGALQNLLALEKPSRLVRARPDAVPRRPSSPPP
tara:strand:- start:360 stop:614 length:255 start_codon:yes stop_codon:yes gene_type:complete